MGELQKGSELPELDFTVLEGCRIRFPWLSITNSYSFCGLKQHKCILRSSKSRCLYGLPLSRDLGKPPPCLFHLLRAPAVFGLWQHHLISAPMFTRLLLSVCLLLLRLLEGQLSLDLGSTWTVQDEFISGYLITSAKSFCTKLIFQIIHRFWGCRKTYL